MLRALLALRMDQRTKHKTNFCALRVYIRRGEVDTKVYTQNVKLGSDKGFGKKNELDGTRGPGAKGRLRGSLVGYRSKVKMRQS